LYGNKTMTLGYISKTWVFPKKVDTVKNKLLIS
jgi:hypothetical protein